MSDPITMATIITAITDLFTGAVGWMTQIVTAVTANPLLLAFVLCAFLGIGISIFKRLTR